MFNLYYQSAPEFCRIRNTLYFFLSAHSHLVSKGYVRKSCIQTWIWTKMTTYFQCYMNFSSPSLKTYSFDAEDENSQRVKSLEWLCFCKCSLRIFQQVWWSSHIVHALKHFVSLLHWNSRETESMNININIVYNFIHFYFLCNGIQTRLIPWTELTNTRKLNEVWT